jgi:hypothetical protein
MTKTQIKSLTYRLNVQIEELKTCTTDAQIKCVQGAIRETRRQLAGK